MPAAGGPAARKSCTWVIGQRSAGSRVMVFSSSAVSHPASTSRGGSSCTIRYSAPITLSPTSYGGRPDRAWNAVAPRPQTSAGGCAVCPEATSGER